jgi:hypothetical protein
MIFLAPLTFGLGKLMLTLESSWPTFITILCCALLAHVHHCWETYNRYGRTLAAAKYAAIATRACCPSPNMYE